LDRVAVVAAAAGVVAIGLNLASAHYGWGQDDDTTLDLVATLDNAGVSIEPGMHSLGSEECPEGGQPAPESAPRVYGYGYTIDGELQLPLSVQPTDLYQLPNGVFAYCGPSFDQNDFPQIGNVILITEP
jgi:hypothetical protein